jgi:carbonic anhydrase
LVKNVQNFFLPSVPAVNQKLILKSTVYALKQFHFHLGKEHTINGKQGDAKLHFVHMSKDGKLAVIVILFKINDQVGLPTLLPWEKGY